MSTRAPSPRDSRFSDTLRARGVAAFLLTLAASLAVVACSKPAPRQAVRYVDLVTRAGVPGAVELPESRMNVCGDLSRVSLPLTQDAPLAVALDLRQEPRLVLAACASREGGAKGRPVPIQISVVTQGDDHHLRRRMAAPIDAWRRTSVDLSPLAGRHAVVKISARTRPGETVWFKDLFVRQIEPAAVDGHGAILISIDALRADALDGFGGKFEVPGFDHLRSRGETWKRCYAAAGWTKPSHATLLTGRTPWAHGAIGVEEGIRPKVATLAQRFRDARFRTAGWAYDSWLLPKFGFGHGFDEYRIESWSAPQLFRAFVEWLAEHRDRPFFVFLHVFDAHSDFAVLPYEVRGRSHDQVAKEFGVTLGPCPGPRCGSELLLSIHRGKPPEPGDRAMITELYRESAAQAADDLQVLWTDLEESGVFGPSMIVLTADHGESLLERGRTLHESLYEEDLRVPLVIKWPHDAEAGRSRRAPASGLDVAPTILAAFDLPHRGLLGADLMRGDHRGPIVAGTYPRAFIDGRYKAIRTAEGEWLLFDLEHDPGETRDLAAEPGMAPTLKKLQEEGERLIARDRRLARDEGSAEESTQTPLSEEEKARLRSLGYLH